MKNTVLVTGGAKGIGKQICIDFARSGYNVCVNYNTSEKEAKLLENELNNEGLSISIYKADVSDRIQVDNMIDTIISRYGSIDVLVNNAGISEYSLFTDISEESFKRMLDIHLLGTFNCTQSVLKKYMINKKEGKIINISSIWGITGASCEVHYSTAKAGMIGFTKALAHELGPCNITVNVVAPGVIDTDMIATLTEEERKGIIDQIPLMRIGNTKDISGLVLFLASDKASYITGQVISPNGGMII
ncbi:MAG: 3-oxoacyl-ACP reductase FabG [Clostridia bacterium]|nr:3-oxoacyl-ACP reductase FabG [Clostridia bacterium]